jgi:hypothetical protein
MDQADPQRPSIQVFPVGQAADRRADRAGQAQCDGGVSAGRVVLLADDVKRVQQDCCRPRADRHIGQHRVERVAQPSAVQEIGDRLGGRAAGLEDALNSLLDCVAGLAEPFLPRQRVNCA